MVRVGRFTRRRCWPESRPLWGDVRFHADFVCLSLNSGRKWARRWTSVADPNRKSTTGCVVDTAGRADGHQSGYPRGGGALFSAWWRGGSQRPRSFFPASIVQLTLGSGRNLPEGLSGCLVASSGFFRNPFPEFLRCGLTKSLNPFGGDQAYIVLARHDWLR